jgi:hypothetical protein
MSELIKLLLNQLIDFHETLYRCRAIAVRVMIVLSSITTTVAEVNIICTHSDIFLKIILPTEISST